MHETLGNKFNQILMAIWLYFLPINLILNSTMAWYLYVRNITDEFIFLYFILHENYLNSILSIVLSSFELLRFFLNSVEVINELNQ